MSYKLVSGHARGVDDIAWETRTLSSPGADQLFGFTCRREIGKRDPAAVDQIIAAKDIRPLFDDEDATEHDTLQPLVATEW